MNVHRDSLRLVWSYTSPEPDVDSHVPLQALRFSTTGNAYLGRASLRVLTHLCYEEDNAQKDG